MTWVKVKINACFGVSNNPSAFVVHEVNPDRTNVVVIRDRPEATRYHVQWYCGKAPKKILLFRHRPTWFSPCKRCEKVKNDPLFWLRVEDINKARTFKKRQIRRVNRKTNDEVSMEDSTLPPSGSGGEETNL